ncbi:hypothetical protein RJJ65_30720 [Rhizobium hidalgonense]|uniref:Uncharacterized protein n=1 Tax=Rhizobium hidalgonense TaxID=1538159 RepID=A0AAJ2GXR7_9HYPH|nr:hypothetical protein [Rhizobium hidalgonense]MDR9776946.1 hypothetical protein [Rhizobium hidalgonense]MDR9814002.1 hypothetical protein [Rhizobium hidalgonense]MDR9820680.1 hypothetical protein [Rhizobium hidalgonense]PON08034.1 hypothetical protein ATY29_08130 [Rhizobium hidalgonense]
MANIILQQAVDSAIAGRTVDAGFATPAASRRREIASLALDDKRAILAAWAFHFYAVDSKPELRQLTETPAKAFLLSMLILIDWAQSDVITSITSSFAHS